jgi:hypothetical protein
MINMKLPMLKIKDSFKKYMVYNPWYWIYLNLLFAVMIFEFLELKDYTIVIFEVICFIMSIIGLILFGLKKLGYNNNNYKKDEVK